MRKHAPKEGKLKSEKPPKSMKNTMAMKNDAPGKTTPTVGKARVGMKRKGAR